LIAVRLLREELQLLQEPGSYVGEVIKVRGKAPGSPPLSSPPPATPNAVVFVAEVKLSRCCSISLIALLQLMGKNKVLVKVNPEGKYVVDVGEWLVLICVEDSWARQLVGSKQLAVYLKLSQAWWCGAVLANATLRCTCHSKTCLLPLSHHHPFPSPFSPASSLTRFLPTHRQGH
jgi:hypothetical protein